MILSEHNVPPKSVGVPSFFHHFSHINDNLWASPFSDSSVSIVIPCMLHLVLSTRSWSRSLLLMVGPSCLSKPSPYLSISIRVPPFHPLRFWWWLTFPLFWNISMCRTPGLCRCIAWLHMALYSRLWVNSSAVQMEKGHLLRKPIPLIWKTP